MAFDRKSYIAMFLQIVLVISLFQSVPVDLSSELQLVRPQLFSVLVEI